MDDLILDDAKVKDLLQQLKAKRQEGRTVAEAIAEQEPKVTKAKVCEFEDINED